MAQDMNHSYIYQSNLLVVIPDAHCSAVPMIPITVFCIQSARNTVIIAVENYGIRLTDHNFQLLDCEHKMGRSE
jgi:hypothetical protein